MDISLDKGLLDGKKKSNDYSHMGKHLGNMDKYLSDNNNNSEEMLESIDEICDNITVNTRKKYYGICPCILQ